MDCTLNGYQCTTILDLLKCLYNPPHNKFASIIIFGDTCDNHLYSMGVLSLGIRIVGVLKVGLCGYVVDMRTKIELY